MARVGRDTRRRRRNRRSSRTSPTSAAAMKAAARPTSAPTTPAPPRTRPSAIAASATLSSAPTTSPRDAMRTALKLPITNPSRDWPNTTPAKRRIGHVSCPSPYAARDERRCDDERDGGNESRHELEHETGSEHLRHPGALRFLGDVTTGGAREACIDRHEHDAPDRQRDRVAAEVERAEQADQGERQRPGHDDAEDLEAECGAGVVSESLARERPRRSRHR